MRLKMFDLAIQPVIEKLIEEVKGCSGRISADQRQGYLGLKIGKNLVCSLYPYRGGFRLGHYSGKRGQGEKWIRPEIQKEDDWKEFLPRIQDRIRFLEFG